MSGASPSWVDDELVTYQSSLKRFLDKEVVPNIDAWRSQGMVDRQIWSTAADFGALGASVPEKFGGAGLSKAYDAMMLIEQARAGDSSWGFGVHNFVTHYLIDYGTDEQKERYLSRLVSGELIAAIAMTEPDTGSDLKSVRTTATPVDSGYLLSGNKTFITNGQLANLICVVAKTDANAGAKGISLLLVETDEVDGFTRGRRLEKLGLKGQDTSELHFDAVQLPDSSLLGGVEGVGFSQLMQQLAWERLVVGLVALGASDRMFADTVAYVSQRETFGKKLIEHQNTRFVLAECKTQLEVLRAFVDNCMSRYLSGDLDAATASMAKLFGSESQCAIADKCLQLYGGYGYMLEYPIAHAYADSRVQRIYGGTSEIMKELIARSLEAA